VKTENHEKLPRCRIVFKNKIFSYPDSIYLPEMDLWLDPSRKKDLAFVSHAHGDHTGRHKRIISTRVTARILEHRLGVKASMTPEWGERIELGRGNLTLFPSGHILGAAQSLVEVRGERLLYTGDFKLKPSRTAEPCEPVSCDHLIMECTYGLPQYKFPAREEVEGAFLDCIQTALEQGRVPVVLAYALGRAQEVIRILSERGIRIAVERGVFALATIYEESGMELGSFEDYVPGEYRDRVIVFPPHLWNAPVLRRIPAKMLIAMTGWAVDGRQNSWYRSDVAFPLSDHADFDDLVTYVKMVRPGNVYLVHGFPEFADHLRDLDMNVEMLQ